METVTKLTGGHYKQVFALNGQCLHSRFYAGDNCEYLDRFNKPILDDDDPRLQFYYPFVSFPNKLES